MAKKRAGKKNIQKKWGSLREREKRDKEKRGMMRVKVRGMHCVVVLCFLIFALTCPPSPMKLEKVKVKNGGEVSQR